MCPDVILENTNMNLTSSPYETEVPVACESGFVVRDRLVRSFTAKCNAKGKWNKAWDCESKCTF